MQLDHVHNLASMLRRMNCHLGLTSWTFTRLTACYCNSRTIVGHAGLQAGHLQDCDAAGIIYEVRVYSLEAASLGQVLHAKQIKAAHCLTSVQFSPTSEHLLLAYGRSVICSFQSPLSV